jgi:hypothetical protein
LTYGRVGQVAPKSLSCGDANSLFHLDPLVRRTNTEPGDKETTKRRIIRRRSGMNFYPAPCD